MTRIRPSLPGRLWRAQGGSTALEFAVTAPLIVLLLASLLDLSLLLVGRSALDAGARAATRYGLTGWVDVDQAGQPGSRRQEIVRILAGYVCPASVTADDSGVCWWTTEGLPLEHRADGAALVIRTDVVGAPATLAGRDPFADADPAVAWDAGGPDDVVVYEIEMAQAVVTPLLRVFMGRTVLHRSRVVVRNEAF